MQVSGLLMVILTLGILAIKVLWVATEPRPWKERFGRGMIATNLLELVILQLQLISAIFFPIPAFGFNSIFVGVGVTMYVIGMALALWARFSMKQAWGFPTEMEKKRQNFLVTDGPFVLSRNPIYVGFILIYFGYAIAIRSWFIVLRIPMVWYFYRSVLQEEKNLEKVFGKQYTEYKKRVPRFLFLRTK